MGREDLEFSSWALNLLGVRSPQGDGPCLRRDLGTWRLEQREPSPGHLFFEVPRTRRQQSLRKSLRSALDNAELSNRALCLVVVGLDDL